MLGSGHLLSGMDIATGTFALMVFGVGAVLVAIFVVARFLLLRAGQSATAGVLWGCALALVAAMFAYALLDRSAAREQAAERRALETRAAELTLRSLAPGSALACLDEVASVVVENACEKPLFASPEAVAAAVAYVDARVSLLAASAAVAQRDPSYRPVLERLRHGLEADRFGLVAHVLATRGCGGADCPELRLLRDPSRVVANLKARPFEASLGAHALAWTSSPGTGVAAASPALPPLATTGAAPGSPVLSSTPPSPASPDQAKFDFPSASSIPPVSIMSAEPALAPEAPPRHAAPAPSSPPTPPKRPAAPRRQTAREAAPVTSAAPQQPQRNSAPPAVAAAPPPPPQPPAPEPAPADAPQGRVERNVY